MHLQSDPIHYAIVCLESGSARLYAELIQTAEHRAVLWVRPLALHINQADESDQASSAALGLEMGYIYDLRDGADLILPLKLFRPALDTEVIPVLSYISHPDYDHQTERSLLQLRQFVDQIYHASPESFRRSNISNKN
jgi:hypothetical protein